jgi:hypothetical protein
MSLSDLLLFALPAVFLTGLSKGGFGGALGGIAVPLLALASTPKQAAAVMLPILCLADVVGLKAYFGKWDVANLKVMMPGALIGIGIGALTFELFNENLSAAQPAAGAHRAAGYVERPVAAIAGQPRLVLPHRLPGHVAGGHPADLAEPVAASAAMADNVRSTSQSFAAEAAPTTGPRAFSLLRDGAAGGYLAILVFRRANPTGG